MPTIKLNNLQACVLWGASEAMEGQPRQAPEEWNKAEQAAWYRGFDSVNVEELCAA
jgi:hypothetical protein